MFGRVGRTGQKERKKLCLPGLPHTRNPVARPVECFVFVVGPPSRRPDYNVCMQRWGTQSYLSYCVPLGNRAVNKRRALSGDPSFAQWSGMPTGGPLRSSSLCALSKAGCFGCSKREPLQFTLAFRLRLVMDLCGQRWQGGGETNILREKTQRFNSANATKSYTTYIQVAQAGLLINSGELGRVIIQSQFCRYYRLVALGGDPGGVKGTTYFFGLPLPLFNFFFFLHLECARSFARLLGGGVNTPSSRGFCSAWLSPSVIVVPLLKISFLSLLSGRVSHTISSESGASCLALSPLHDRTTRATIFLVGSFAPSPNCEATSTQHSSRRAKPPW